MTSSRWAWIWFLAAFIFFGFGFAYQIDVIGAGITIGDAMANPSIKTPQGQNFIRELNREGDVAMAKVVAGIVLAAICVGVGIRKKYDWPVFRAFIFAFLACPTALIATDYGAGLFLRFIYS